MKKTKEIESKPARPSSTEGRGENARTAAAAEARRPRPSILLQALRLVSSVLIRIGLRIYNRFEIVGQENLRTNRSLVIVSNHSSHLDTPCLLSALPLPALSRVFPVAAEDYFF